MSCSVLTRHVIRDFEPVNGKEPCVNIRKCLLILEGGREGENRDRERRRGEGGREKDRERLRLIDCQVG